MPSTKMSRLSFRTASSTSSGVRVLLELFGRLRILLKEWAVAAADEDILRQLRPAVGSQSSVHERSLDAREVAKCG